MVLYFSSNLMLTQAGGAYKKSLLVNNERVPANYLLSLLPNMLLSFPNMG